MSRNMLPSLRKGSGVPSSKSNKFQASNSSTDGPLAATAVFSHVKNIMLGPTPAGLASGAGEPREDATSLLHMHSYVNSPVQSLCVEMLTAGHVRSFEDFFFLTHEAAQDENAMFQEALPVKEQNNTGAPPSLSETTGAGSGMTVAAAGGTAQITEMLQYIKEHLSEAEHCLRQGTSAVARRSPDPAGDIKGAINAYQLLAEHFEKAGDMGSTRVAIHFYQKCLAMAQQAGDPTLEGQANSNLGLCYQNIGNIELAIQYYEKFSFQAKEGQEAESARRRLVNAYKSYAEDCENNDDFLLAVEYYEKCLDKARECIDEEAEGIANYRLGLCYKQLKDSERSIKHLMNYLEICRNRGDEVGEGVACSALAFAHQNKNDLDKSIKYLEENFMLAQRTKQLDAQGKACCNLGIIYHKNGDYEKASQYFEQYFSIARQTGDRRMSDNARVYLGIARGNLKISQFLKLVPRTSSSEIIVDLLNKTFGKQRI